LTVYTKFFIPSKHTIIDFTSINDFFTEVTNNYIKNYNKDKNDLKCLDKNKKLNNDWYYAYKIRKSIKLYIKNNVEIRKNHISTGLENIPPKPENIDTINISILPTNHTKSCGVYLLIRMNKENTEIINFDFTFSNSNKPSPAIQNLLDKINNKYGCKIDFHDSNLSNVFIEKVNLFSTISEKYKFNKMKLNSKEWNVNYQIPNLSSEDSSSSNNLPQAVKYLTTHSNFILYGPPGTGKTYKTVDISAGVIENKFDYKNIDEIINNDNHHSDNTSIFNDGLDKGRIHFVTFHQNYSYEEFVGGLRPVIDKEKSNGNLQFEWKPGIFIKACANALELARSKDKKKWNEEKKGEKSIEDWFLRECSQYKYNDYKFNKETPKVVLIIDEINRANISRVFGELITLIEDDKRIGGKHQLILTLPNGAKKFGVPTNLIIIGTMNTADKSLALLDVALRRRFEFIGLFPKKELVLNNKLRSIFEKLNKQILAERKSPNLLIGHSYFMDKKEEDLDTIFNNKVIPLLNEYFMGNRKKVEEILKDIVSVKENLDTGVLECNSKDVQKSNNADSQ